MGKDLQQWMAFHEWMDAAQTAMLIVIALVLIYFVHLLRNEIRRAASLLAQVIAGQQQLDQNVRRSWERIDAIEARISGLENPRSQSP
jgi:membrane-anchored glycerophosphoryl diester phosphodiesterase (GDPDase)